MVVLIAEEVLVGLELELGQALSSPDIGRTNGAVGSFWSSYTPAELKAVLSGVDFDGVHIEPQFGLMFASGNKVKETLTGANEIN